MRVLGCLAAALCCGAASARASTLLIMVGGDLTISGRRGISLAQYDVGLRTWSDEYEPQLYVYGTSEAPGSAAVYGFAVNRTSSAGPLLFRRFAEAGRRAFAAEEDEVFVVGQFDSISEESQSQYCSVGRWVGMAAPNKALERVGEGGLCSRASDPATRIYATQLGAPGEIFVGGTFSSRVWDGLRFDAVRHVARFDAIKSLWLPLRGGALELARPAAASPGEPRQSNASEVAVLALAYDDGKLFVGGRFDRLGSLPLSANLAEWTENAGLTNFSGGGAVLGGGGAASVAALAVDARRGLIYVAGAFDGVASGQVPCETLAAFAYGAFARAAARGVSDAAPFWRCVASAAHGFEQAPLALLHDGNALYVAGQARASSTWARGNRTGTAAIATFARRAGPPAERDAFSRRGAPTAAPTRAVPRAAHAGGRDAEDPFEGSLPYDGAGVDDDDGGARGAGAGRGATTEWGWEWLPGWQGLDGTIFAISAGSGALEGCVLVGGDFAGEPPLYIWRRDDKLGPYTTRLGGRDGGTLGGRVTSVAMLHAVYPAAAGAAGGGTADVRHDIAAAPRLAEAALALGLFLLSACVALALRCRGAGAARQAGISLQTLSYGFSPDLDFEFSEAYEKAMAARHLGNRHLLVMIDPSEIVLHHVIGEGSFGRVWAATWQSSQVAVKEFVLAQAAFAGGSFQRRDIIEEIVGEAGIMAYLRHPKILQLYGCSLTAQAIWIVSELCAHGSLRQVLDDPTKQLSLAKRLRMAIDVAEGMLYLHTREKPIVHRDLKSHNLFVAEHHGRMNVRIGDWGSARAVAMTPNSSRTMTHGVGTTCWLAPELIKDAKGSERIDVYAFGIVLWEIATREEVYPALSAAQIISRVANEGMRPPLPIGCPWNHVMQQCWAEDPQDRPAFEAIFQQLTEIHRRLVERRKRVKRRRAREASASSETSSGASAGDRSSGASADGDDDSDSDS